MINQESDFIRKLNYIQGHYVCLRSDILINEFSRELGDMNEKHCNFDTILLYVEKTIALRMNIFQLGNRKNSAFLI